MQKGAYLEADMSSKQRKFCLDSLLNFTRGFVRGVSKILILSKTECSLPPQKFCWLLTTLSLSLMSLMSCTLTVPGHFCSQIVTISRLWQSYKSENKSWLHWKSCHQNLSRKVCLQVSMIDADLFDMVANVAKYIRGSEEPFGGIQLILSGDFHQLPPVNKREDNKPRKFCFESHAWKNCRLHCLQLTKVYRQVYTCREHSSVWDL